MGMLDVSDADIKKGPRYEQAQKAMTALDESVAAFKKASGSGTVVKDVGRACRAAFMAIDRGLKDFPDFKEFKDMRKNVMDTAKEVLKKDAENLDVKSYVADANYKEV